MLIICLYKEHNSTTLTVSYRTKTPYLAVSVFATPSCLCIVEPWRPIDSLPQIASFPLVVQGFAYPPSALCSWNRCVLPCSRCGCNSPIWLDGAERNLISRTSLLSWQPGNIPTGVCLWKGGAAGHFCYLYADWNKHTLFHRLFSPPQT